MQTIEMTALDAALIADLDGEDLKDWQAYEDTIEGADGYITGNRHQIVHSAVCQRGGITLVGSGSSGVTAWTDAATPDEVLARHLADDMTS